MAQLAALLRTDLSRMAEEVRRAGRGKDTMLAHITPKEAALLKARGGRGSINPDTGLPEFETDDSEIYGFGYEGAPYTQPVQPQPQMQSQDIYQPTNFPAEGEYGAPSTPIDMRGAITETGAFGGVGEMPAARGAQARLESLGAGQPTYGQGYGGPEPIELGIAGGVAGAPSAAPPQEKSILDRLQAGLRTPLGYGALGAIPAILQSRRAAGQAKGLQSELGKLGQEARTTGQQLVAQARAGQLPAAQQQALEAQRLAAMQNLQRRGVTDSTAMQQVENQLAQQRAVFIDQTLNEGMRLINVADQYTKQAIMAGYQADAQAQQLLGNFFNNYMRVLAGQPQTPPPKG
ncbi:MAG: hypothetical protein EBS18_00640 [Actinobacteria bacterium]|nr:hypothetical protein [Actinomycetota bacterium]